MALFLLVVIAALAFEYINGFHDAANAIATVVSTKVLTPRQAIAMAAFFNLTGALMGTAVATTIGKGMVDLKVVTMRTILCALLGAIVWNLATWLLGLPSSSSHALIGGLCGAALASAGGDFAVLKWRTGLLPKVVLPMISSPIAGFIFGALLMFLLLVVLRSFTPHFVHTIFGKLQLVERRLDGAQPRDERRPKNHGHHRARAFHRHEQRHLRAVSRALLHFLNTPVFQVPTWVVFACAATMAAGTAAGGWRIIRTLGHKMVKLQPVHGFAAETTAAVIIQVASSYGIPLSTTHVISTSIMGVGAVKRFSGVKWGVVQRIIWAWVFTLPVTALISYLLARLWALL